MKRIQEMLVRLIKGMSRAGERFPLTVLSLIGAEGIICYTISLNDLPGLIIQKIMFALVVCAFLGMAGQFAIERFEKLSGMRPVLYGVAVALTVGYFFILWPVPAITAEIGIRTFITVFALLCIVLWVPSYQGKAQENAQENAQGKTDFNKVALIHFKAMFTAILYSGVLSAGISAIVVSVDILLFRVDTDVYGYTNSIIWVLFATIYYLSLLPRFGSLKEDDLKMLDRSDNYPKFLEILISYIAIPLIAAYTLVLVAYFVKILITANWPSNEVGIMVLIYSAAGLLVFILSSLLENRFAHLYRMIFPKVLIPVVIMQLVSVWIRLDAYGITESRYYVALFGLFTITVGLLLSIKPVSKNGLIALLAAGFALISIIPPVDVFTLSRDSQIHRVEAYLEADGILKDGKLIPNETASELTKVETTNILTYLDNRSSLKQVTWLPEDFNLYQDMKSTLGFEPTYSSSPGEQNQYFYASLDTTKPLNISGYNVSVVLYSDRYTEGKSSSPYNFTLNGVDYVLSAERVSKNEAIIRVKDSAGKEMISTGLYTFATALTKDGSQSKELATPDEMTLEVEQNGAKMKIIFQNISITYGNGTDAGVDYSAYVFFASPL